MKTFAFSLLRLLQFLACSASAQYEKDSIVAAIGSSVLLPGMDKGFSSLQWDFSKPGKILPILDYNEGHQETCNLYKNRVELNKSDGSLLLKDVREGDTGRYKVTVDLDPIRTRIVTLTVFDPLPTPTISSNYSLEHHTVMLNCVVQRGKAHSVQWTKGRLALPAHERHWMSEDNRTLFIWNARKSDSGYYTCTVVNPVGQNNTTYQLSIKSYGPNSRGQFALVPAIVVCLAMLLGVIACHRVRRCYNTV
ncbi:carcinoembryonic antigen-related cell adhesion molecule 1-like isoform X2 [Rhincodon typus]|uniref:carcinoembryonic antigen-related cell adhesion molecule 1-like isoform X2 n=1 Tax=Rhincodon typus TaxID=259920 RepID=UPI00202EA110|nr:carcinoembryonic antigen-related cell adhesion molecule 1-like isoform X2 [Rhincodon typus]